MKIAVLGAGNLGLAQAGHLASQGHAVSLYNRSAPRLGGLLEGGALRLRGILDASIGFERVSMDLAAVVRDAELIFVDVPATAHLAMAIDLREALPRDSQALLLLHPGQTFGALDFARQLDLSLFPQIVLGELQTALYTARTLAPGEVTILAIKREVAVAAYPAANSGRLSPVCGLYPQLFLEANTLVTAISNVQSFIHPAVCLFNLARIEQEEPFRIYRQGLSAGVGACFEACDVERLMLATRLGVSVPAASTWFGRCYGVSGASALEAMRQVEAYDDLMGPKGLETRLLHEDVPTGLVPLVDLCDVYGVDAPNLAGLLAMCRSILGHRIEGERTLERLGLSGLKVEALRAAF